MKKYLKKGKSNILLKLRTNYNEKSECEVNMKTTKVLYMRVLLILFPKWIPVFYIILGSKKMITFETGVLHIKVKSVHSATGLKSSLLYV